MALTLGPIARPLPTERRAPAPGSFDPRPAPHGRAAVSPTAERSDAAVVTAHSATAAHPTRRTAPQGGPGPVGCECCGRLATADTHLSRTDPPSPMAASASAADRVAERYRRNAPDRTAAAVGGADASRSVIS